MKPGRKKALETGILADVAKAVGSAAGFVASMLGTTLEAKVGPEKSKPSRKASPKVAKKVSARSPRLEKKTIAKKVVATAKKRTSPKTK